MPLTDVYSAGGNLLAQKAGAVAISEPRTQQLIDTDYRKCKNTRIRWYLDNISSSTQPDLLITSQLIQTGDKIFIRKADQSIVEFIVPAGAVTASQEADLIPTMTTKTFPYGVVTGTRSDVLNAFDFSLTTSAYLQNGGYLAYQFYGNEPKTAYKVYYRSTTYVPYFRFILEGSTNGLDYTTIFTSPDTGTAAEHTYTITSPGAYSHYRMKATNAQTNIYDFKLLGDGYAIDTSSVTAGDVPSQAWKFSDEVRFNETLLISNNEDVIYGISYDRLHVYAQYDDAVFYPTRELITKYTFNTAGNMMLEQTNEIYDLWLKQGNATHTSNTSPANTVSVIGPDAPIATDAWKIFDEDVATDGYSITTDASGNVDFSHIYEFDTAKTCHAIKMTTGLYTEAPAHYKVFGSFDGVTYTELLDVIQNVAVDDLSLTKYFDGSLYDAYKFYKIQVLEGNTPSSVVSAKTYTLLEEDILA